MISESGISERQNDAGVYAKVYQINGNLKDEQMKDTLYELCKLFCEEQMYLQLFRDKENCYLLLGQWMQSMEKAQMRFDEIEKQMISEFLPLDLNARIGQCLKIETVLKGKKVYSADYLSHPEEWKEMVDLKKSLILDGKYLQSGAGCFSIVTVQKFPYSDEKSWMEEILKQEFVLASISEMEMISNTVVKDLFFHCYTGVDNVISRMKRVNPALYQVLTEEQKEEKEGVHFVKGAVGFLLNAETAEQMEEHIDLLKETAKKNHFKIRCSRVPDAGEFRVFAMTGERFDSSGQILLASDCRSLIPFSAQNEENYDVEELKRLFLK